MVLVAVLRVEREKNHREYKELREGSGREKALLSTWRWTEKAGPIVRIKPI